jgi:hypothetical protein
MQKIIDFSKGTQTKPTIIQPDFSIQSRTCAITHLPWVDGFRVAVGCQSVQVTKSVLNEMKEALKFAEPKEVERTLITKKGGRVTKSSAELSETSDSFFISKGNKLYPKAGYETKAVKHTPAPKYFKLTGKQVRVNVTGNFDDSRYWYTVTSSEFENIKFIIDRLDGYFNPVVKEKKPAAKKKA